MAGMQAILLHNSKAIAVQRGSASCTGTAAAEDERKLQAMLFAMLQEQNNRLIVAMTATNKDNMDGMMERMNTLVAGGVGRHPTHQDKESTLIVLGISLPALTGSGTTQPKKPKRRKCICPHCKMCVLHKPKNCVELEVNKDKRWPGWKLVHTIA
jgi:hypothetical protein